MWIFTVLGIIALFVAFRNGYVYRNLVDFAVPGAIGSVLVAYGSDLSFWQGAGVFAGALAITFIVSET